MALRELAWFAPVTSEQAALSSRRPRARIGTILLRRLQPISLPSEFLPACSAGARCCTFAQLMVQRRQLAWIMRHFAPLLQSGTRVARLVQLKIQTRQAAIDRSQRRIQSARVQVMFERLGGSLQI